MTATWRVVALPTGDLTFPLDDGRYPGQTVVSSPRAVIRRARPG